MNRSSMHGHRPPGKILLVAALTLVSGISSARSDELGAALKPHVGLPLDVVELATGTRFARPVLEGIVTRDETT
ncbi:MAG: hypothetical protein ACKOTB_12495, partial [Planctomycetia bacterium]